MAYLFVQIRAEHRGTRERALSLTLVVLQARTASSRLPEKALLRLGGIESALLAALRAKNLGHRVVLATSDHASDDFLAHRAAMEGIEVFRGHVQDVRSRFVEVSQRMSADDVLVRLTADNAFPDGDLVQLAVSALQDSGDELVRSMEDPRVPFGLSVEAFRVSALRESLSDSSPEAQEHVTIPMVRRQKSFVTFVPIKEDLSRLRCTLDTVSDYAMLQTVFAGVQAPLTISWQGLVERLKAISEHPIETNERHASP